MTRLSEHNNKDTANRPRILIINTGGRAAESQETAVVEAAGAPPSGDGGAFGDEDARALHMLKRTQTSSDIRMPDAAATESSPGQSSTHHNKVSPPPRTSEAQQGKKLDLMMTGSLERDLEGMDELRRSHMPRYDVVELKPLKHGADIGSREWAILASIIKKNYYSYNGFVIVHGTDTICYTATALSFLLMNLGKPVMLTGSLIPAHMVHTDLKRNLILSLLFASSEQICEVCIVFAEKLFRGNRCSKLSGVSLQPFGTPFCPPLAMMRSQQMQLQKQVLRPAPTGRLTAFTDMSAKVLTIKIVPGVSKAVLVHLIQKSDAKAVIFVGFGSGNTPIRGGAVTTACQLARSKGMVVCISTQVKSGLVNLRDYEAGRHLLDAGVVGTEDMTIETVVLKLKYLFGRGYSSPDVAQLMIKNLRGEITPPVTTSKL